MTLVAGPNYVVSVHGGGIDFVDELREREKGETGIGALSSESFVASLLDWLLNSYFQALELVVREIDRVEVAVLSHRDPSTIAHQVELLIQARRRVAEIRRLLISHRDVFYGLARPDFMATEKPETRPHFIALNSRLERAEDDVDHARELIVGAFDLLSTRAAQKTNDTMRVLTFVTVLLGTLALVAGVMGMNFELPFFQDPRGFWIVAGSMLGGSLLALAVGKWRKWF
jgi:Mg2+ and Co2+ transporter CorA